jgi:Flp pilus assembly protein TadD
MGQQPDQPVTGEVARDLCQRVGGKAFIQGSLSKIENQYLLDLKAINCSTGDTLVSEQSRASGKDAVLKALDTSTASIRTSLGESLASVQKFATPIEEATTPSLEALKAYSQGNRIQQLQGDVPSLPFTLRAIELDPNFAVAYSGVAVSYSNLGRLELASEYAQKAFDLKAKVSEREKYRISGFYYSLVTGEIDKSSEVYEQWHLNYPKDNSPATNLGNNDMTIGNWEEALKVSRDSEEIEPNSGPTISNLGYILLALERTDECSQHLQQAIGRKMDNFFIRQPLYHLGFIQKNQAIMDQQLAWAAGRIGEEDWFFEAQANTEAFNGRIRKAREYLTRAIDSAVRADSKETAATWEADLALQEAEYGNAKEAQTKATAAVALSPGKLVRSLAAMAYARSGDSARAQKLADGLDKEFPRDTLTQAYWLPTIRAAVEYNGKNATKAIQILERTSTYEFGQIQPQNIAMLYPAFVRGQAFLLNHQPNEAVKEFQKIISRPGMVLNSHTYPMAKLGLARAYAQQGDAVKARAAYMEFIDLWKDADLDLPILREAKAEWAKL